MSDTKYIDTADTAKLVRAALKAEYPAMTFKVRISRYSGGSSVDVKWIDGPTDAMVKRTLEPYRGDYFDGMIDYHGGVVREVEGQHVQYMGSIGTTREYSPQLLLAVAEREARRFGKPVPRLIESRWTWKGKESVDYYLDRETELMDSWSHDTVTDHIMRELHETAASADGQPLAKVRVRHNDDAPSNIVRTY